MEDAANTTTDNENNTELYQSKILSDCDINIENDDNDFEENNIKLQLINNGEVEDANEVIVNKKKINKDINYGTKQEVVGNNEKNISDHKILNTNDETKTDTKNKKYIEADVPIVQKVNLKKKEIPFSQIDDDMETEIALVNYQPVETEVCKKYPKRLPKPKIEEPPKPLPPKRRRKGYDESVNHEGPFTCEICNFTSSTKTGMLNHVRIHERTNKFKCMLCKEEFISNDELVEHKKRCHIIGQTNFMCKQCQLAFSNHLEYLLHRIMTHMNRGEYRCEECPSVFKHKYLYRDHIATHYDAGLKCDVCNKTFKTETLYANHMKRHSNPHNNNKQEHDEKDHNKRPCPECGKLVECLSNHMITHTGVRVIQCWYCGRGFSSSQQRENHMRIHTNERPFRCKVCDQGFKQKGDVSKHEKKHTNRIKDVECKYCGKKFLHKESLLQHERIHTRKNLLPCLQCGMEFMNKTCLKSHMQYHHNDGTKFSCDICNSDFKALGLLQRHNKTNKHLNNVYGKKFKMKGKSDA